MFSVKTIFKPTFTSQDSIASTSGRSSRSRSSINKAIFNITLKQHAGMCTSNQVCVCTLTDSTDATTTAVRSTNQSFQHHLSASVWQQESRLSGRLLISDRRRRRRRRRSRDHSLLRSWKHDNQQKNVYTQNPHYQNYSTIVSIPSYTSDQMIGEVHISNYSGDFSWCLPFCIARLACAFLVSQN